MLEIAKICVKWIKYLRNGFNMWEMTWRLWKWLTFLGNGSDIWC